MILHWLDAGLVAAFLGGRELEDGHGGEVAPNGPATSCSRRGKVGAVHAEEKTPGSADFPRVRCPVSAFHALPPRAPVACFIKMGPPHREEAHRDVVCMFEFRMLRT